MQKTYELFPTAKKTARVNHLYYSGRDDIYYDFEVLDNMTDITEEQKELIRQDHMRYNSVSWYSDPIPVLAIETEYKHWNGQLKTVHQKVFRKTGKRVMVIVTITAVHLETWERDSIYDRYFHKTNEYNAKSYYTQGIEDLEIA